MLLWLKEIRGGQSQTAVAKKIGIAQSTYACVETGNRNPSVRLAKRIAKVLGFDWKLFYDEAESANGTIENGKIGTTPDELFAANDQENSVKEVTPSQAQAKEILGKQLELLAEVSRNICRPEELAIISKAMALIAEFLIVR